VENLDQKQVVETARPPQFNTLDHWLFRLVGIDTELAAKLTVDEHHQMRKCAWSQIAGTSFLFLIVNIGLFASNVPESYLGRLVLLLIGISLTCVYFTFDCVWNASHWKEHGEAFAAQNKIIERSSSRKLRFTKGLVRIVMSAIAAITFAVPATLHVFHDDVNSYLVNENKLANATLINTANTTFDNLLKDVSDRIAIIGKASVDFQTEKQKLLSPSIGANANQMNALNQRRKDVLLRKDKASEAIKNATADAIAENQGVKMNEKHSGERGQGRKFLYYRDIVRLQSNEVELADSELKAIDQQIAAMSQAQTAASAQALQNSGQRLTAVDVQLGVQNKSRDFLSGELQRLQDSRQDWINKFVSKDASYVPLDTGLMSRMTALASKSAGKPELWVTILFVKFLIMIAEAAGPIATMLMTTTGLYGLRVAVRLNDELENMKEARDGARFEKSMKRHQQDNFWRENTAQQSQPADRPQSSEFDTQRHAAE
jgi:hypothetical protein